MSMNPEETCREPLYTSPSGNRSTRRDWLSDSLALLGAGLFAGSAGGLANACRAAEPDSKPTIRGTAVSSTFSVVDTHQHLWDLDKFHLPWVGGEKLLNRSFLLSDYATATEGIPIAKTVYMEVDVDPAQQSLEADYVIALCERDDNSMAGAVISGRPNSTEFAPYIEKYAKNKYIKGVRQVLHAPSAQQCLCLEPQFVKSIQLLGDLGLCYDLCMRPGELIDGAKLVEQCPKTRFVVDHCGNMEVTSQDAELRKSWETAIRALAAHERVVCKISGIVATAKEKWQPADLASVVNFCLDAFGEDRVIFGGDWPVCTLRATYKQWYDALVEIVSGRSETFRRKLFHDNAVKFYGLA